MQTTLLGIAIALILMLVAALVGPLFIDWSQFRGEFERTLAGMTGLPARIGGDIDARLLPTPMLTLREVEIGQGQTVMRAHALHLEFALPALLRRELRVDLAKLDGPRLEIALDEAGRLAWPASAGSAVSQTLSIERLSITDGRATLAVAGGSSIVLDKLAFSGALRSLTGPLKGEGEFLANARQYPYRVSILGMPGEGSVKLHLNLDPVDAEAVELDAVASLPNQQPRLDGSLVISRLPARGTAAARAQVPWRLTSRINVHSAGAALDQLELEYGPAEQATRLRGEARLKFGAQAQLTAALSAPQLDVDRAVSSPDRRRPLDLLRALAQSNPGSFAPPIPIALRLNVDALTIGGGTLQQVSAELSRDAGGWIVDSLDLRAPGLSRLRFSGRFDPARADRSFEGSASLDSGDPRALLTWLSDRADLAAFASGALRMRGDVSLNDERIAVSGFSAELERVALQGSLLYLRQREDEPANLQITIATSELDFDKVHALAKAIIGDAGLDWPGQGTVSLKAQHATYAGIEAKSSELTLQLEPEGLAIEKLQIADLSGMALAANGRIDTPRRSPHGSLSVDLKIASPEGMTKLLEKFAPDEAEAGIAGRLVPLALHGTVGFDAAASPLAKFKLDGQGGVYRGGVEGEAAAAEGFKPDDLATLRSAGVDVSARLDADDGRALVALTGLDRLVVADAQGGRLALKAKGRLDDALAVDGRMTVGELGVTANGVVHASEPKRSAALAVQFVNAKLRSPRPPGAAVATLPASGSFALSFADGRLTFSELKGTVAGESVTGRLGIDTKQQPMAFDADLELSGLDLSGGIEVAAGVPAVQGDAPADAWREEPFERASRPALGQIALKVARVALTPGLAATQLSARIYVGGSQLATQVLDATVAGGHATGELVFLRQESGLIARGRLKVVEAETAELAPGGAVAGRCTFDLDFEGSGLSPLALLRALHGQGRMSLTEGRLAKLDPGAFDAVIRATDQGMPIDADRVNARVDTALAKGSIPIRRAEAGIIIDGGQIRVLTNPQAAVPDVELAVNAAVNLVDGGMDARLTLSALPAGSAAAAVWPELTVSWKGPLTAPKRTVDASAFANWLALRAVEQQSNKLDLLQGHDPVREDRSAPLSNRLTSPPAAQP